MHHLLALLLVLLRNLQGHAGVALRVQRGGLQHQAVVDAADALQQRVALAFLQLHVSGGQNVHCLLLIDITAKGNSNSLNLCK